MCKNMAIFYYYFGDFLKGIFDGILFFEKKIATKRHTNW
jgi:hypothetical protein